MKCWETTCRTQWRNMCGGWRCRLAAISNDHVTNISTHYHANIYPTTYPYHYDRYFWVYVILRLFRPRLCSSRLPSQRSGTDSSSKSWSSLLGVARSANRKSCANCAGVSFYLNSLMSPSKNCPDSSICFFLWRIWLAQRRISLPLKAIPSPCSSRKRL